MLSDNIVSERLILRNVTKDDSKDIWEIWSNSENEKYMGDPVESIEEVIAICKKREKDSGTGFLTVATLKDTGEVIGTCCFGPTNRKDEWGFGYSIKQGFWGKGYATEIVKSVIKFGYSLGIKDFISDCAIENAASGRVLEKCGMHIDHKSSFKQPKINIIYESHVYKLHID
ncbi:GNAT family N-acetyltransferase [Clostridium nigeriense]|uniref:GNAT family N-acetyltransferase n=1 Tax=Clostridium nigeriense TaxID=1805470 RepID=UPI003D332D9E